MTPVIPSIYSFRLFSVILLLMLKYQIIKQCEIISNIFFLKFGKKIVILINLNYPSNVMFFSGRGLKADHLLYDKKVPPYL